MNLPAAEPEVSADHSLPLRVVSRIWPWFAAAFSGVLLALCYPPFNQGWLAWVALTPWMAALWLGPQPKRRAWLRDSLLGYAAGVFFFQLVFSWLTSVTTIGAIALNFYLALYFAAWSWFAGLIARGGRNWLSSRANLWLALCVSFGWITFEFLRGWVFTGFAWNNLGVSLWQNLPMIQIADLAGVFGISFLLVFANTIALATVVRFTSEVRSMRLRPHFDFTTTMALIGIVFVYGVMAMRKVVPRNHIQAAVVQPNISQDRKWDPNEAVEILDTYEDLSIQALASKPHLLLWPEASTPGPLKYDALSRAVVDRIVTSNPNIDFLLGTVEDELTEKGEKGYNVAVLFSNAGKEEQSYRKIHLVPFGEYIPFRESFPIFAWIAGGQVPGDFTSGPEPKVMQLGSTPATIAPLICFEDTLPYLTRKFVRKGADVLVNITNDGWFLETQGSMQHLANAVFRTIEFRRPMVRAANTGVSCLVDDRGMVTQMLADEHGNTFIQGIMQGSVLAPIEPVDTVYSRYGEWFVWLSMIGTAWLIYFYRRRTSVA